MAEKTLVGYCEPLSVAPGESVAFKVSCDAPGAYRADIVRLICGDTSSQGAGFKEVEVSTPVSGEYPGREQIARPGSCAQVAPFPALAQLTSFTAQAVIWPTAPGGDPQAILGTWSEARGAGFALLVDSGGALALVVGDGAGNAAATSTDTPLREREWCFVAGAFDAETGAVTLVQEPLARSPSMQVVARRAHVERRIAKDAHAPEAGPLLIAAWRESDDVRVGVTGGHFNGKIDSPRLADRALTRAEMSALLGDEVPPALARSVVGAWDLSRDIPSLRILDVSGNDRHGEVRNLPTRGVTGFNWMGAAQSWREAPEQYGAIHFHDDDLYDAGWETDFELVVPPDLPSGVYAARLRLGEAEDYVPFFVRPPRGTATAEFAYLAPTATYMAYANQKLHLSGRLGNPPEQIHPNDEFMLRHPEFAGGLYEHHSDHSGVHYSSRRRPILNLKAKHSLWAFNADTNVTDWLEHTGHRYDVITDEDLHVEGADLLRRYRVIVTGTHPEYWSTAMLDALEAYLSGGGRLMYLGGNGFYWRIAFHRELPGVIEVRRAEDGTRAWISEPGEYYHSFNGEYGGLWRRLGRPPNRLAGVGFAAQGFDGSSHYRLREGSRDARAGFIFRGVEEGEVLGDYGRIGGGAAGEELDRCDPRLGSPPHALILASSEDHKPGMLRTKEELYATTLPRKDPRARSDLVFFEGPKGGAVFSTGSIAWAGSLAHNEYRNDVCRVTTNVLERFLDPEPFRTPEKG